jgi:mono/diheme cytochrome c family protein
MQPWLRRTLKTLSVILAVLVTLVIGIIICVVVAWDEPVARPVREMHAPRDAQTVARGAYLYQRRMLCWTCHGSSGGRDAREPQAGGKEFDLRNIGPGFGTVWGSNLTSDFETGVGRATDGQLVRAIREGIDQRGRVIFPVMAYQFYHELSDADALAIVAYLRTLAPVRRPVPERDLSFIAKTLIAFGVIAPNADVTTPVVAPPAGPTVEYGRYVTWHASGCAECHTPRFPENGQLDRTRLMAGGLFAFPEEGFTTTASNLTPDAATGLGRWTEAQFVKAVRMGVRPDGTVILPFMPWPTYASWDDEDLRAVWLYLRSTPAISHAVPPSKLTGAAAGPAGVPRGAAIFDVYCAACHGEQGHGGSLTTITLSDFAHDADAETLTAFVVEGGPPASGMPAFGKTLTKDQVNDVVAYLLRRRHNTD